MENNTKIYVQMCYNRARSTRVFLCNFGKEKHMFTLFLDTHSSTIRMILYKEEQPIIEKEIETEKNQSSRVMPVLIQVLEEAKIEIKNIKEIIVVNGPGSFTGVRIGVTIAKTLAFTLNIPIKVMSSLLVKAVSISHEKINIIEREKNGVFLGTFDKNNQLLEEYKYLSNKEYEAWAYKEEAIEDIELDYEKIYYFAKEIKSTNPHAVNPLYVKKIEVQK